MLLNMCKVCPGILLACSQGVKCSFGITKEAEKKKNLFTLKASKILQGCSYHWRYLSDEWVHEKCPDQHNTEVIIKYETLI